MTKLTKSQYIFMFGQNKMWPHFVREIIRDNGMLNINHASVRKIENSKCIRVCILFVRCKVFEAILHIQKGCVLFRIFVLHCPFHWRLAAWTSSNGSSVDIRHRKEICDLLFRFWWKGECRSSVSLELCFESVGILIFQNFVACISFLLRSWLHLQK